jgi:ketosteroid isomerase-like protein
MEKHMSTSSSRDLVAAAFAELAAGNGRAFVAALADDIVWRNIGSTSWSGTVRGKQMLIDERFAIAGRLLDGPNTIIPLRIIAEGDLVVVEAKGGSRLKRGGTYENDYCFVIRVAGDKIVEVTEYLDTEMLTSALGERV